jgi:dihydroorotase
MWKAGAMAFGETFFAPSSYGEAISGQQLTYALGQIGSLGALATIHAEEVSNGTDTSLLTHDMLRSPYGELRAVEAVRKYNIRGCHLHFCHLSTKAAVAAAPGTVEVTPHHLFLSREQMNERDTLGKVNPPIRSEKERRELFSAWEQIDVIASDHAPHTRLDKLVPFPDAPSGIPGVETMVPLLLAQVLDKKICLPDLVMKTSNIPAALLGIVPAGFTVGNRGDFALYRKKAVPVDPGLLHSKCAWTPFEGLQAVFPREVIMGGITVYKEREFFPGNPVWLTGRGCLPRSNMRTRSGLVSFLDAPSPSAKYPDR